VGSTLLQALSLVNGMLRVQRLVLHVRADCVQFVDQPCWNDGCENFNKLCIASVERVGSSLKKSSVGEELVLHFFLPKKPFFSGFSSVLEASDLSAFLPKPNSDFLVVVVSAGAVPGWVEAHVNHLHSIRDHSVVV
jgi:hypothetical protein